MGELSSLDASSEKQSGGEKKKKSGDDGVIVLKADLHCEGCLKKISRSIKRFEGVKKVSGDIASNKLTVTGKVDPVKLKERIESKINKKVDLISPQPKKDNGPGGDDKKKNNKAEDQKSEKKNKEATVVLKTPLHCQGCIEKMQKIINKTKGVQEVTIDAQKETVTVKGTMAVKALQSSLQDKLKRGVEIVPPKKDTDDSGGAGEKNKKDSGGGGGGGGGAEPSWGGFSRAEYNYGPTYYGRQPGYFVDSVHPPQYFSDENPNACSAM